MSKDTGAVALYVTWPDLATAEAAGQALVAARRAASVNILPGARSIYWWHGKIERTGEVVMIAKTARRHVDAAIAAIVASHPYDTPGVIVLDIIDGSRRYLDWLHAEVAGPP